MPDPLRLVIFDNDGVLVDSESLSSSTLARVLNGFGVPATPAQCRRDFTGFPVTLVRTVVEARMRAVLPVSFEAVYAGELAEVFGHELGPSAGVPALLDVLDERGIAYCVASNGTRQRLEMSLRAAGLLARFAGRLFSVEQVARPKPAPDLFLAAAGTLGIAPAECLVVEDTPTGIAAANAAGMFAWAPASTYPADELPGAGRISPTMADLGRELRAELDSRAAARVGRG